MNLTFLALGDWGYIGANQTAVAAQMGVYAAQTNASFVVALGDNFYEDGVESDLDELWTNAYSSVYSAQALQVPWYAVLGNHDFHKNPEAQIAFYKNRRDGRWNMPEHCYWKTWSIPGTLSSTLEIVFIDTAILAPEVTPQTARGGIYEVSTEEVDANYRMIETRLRESTATWLLVAGHYTIFSEGGHGDYRILVHRLAPLLARYRVHLYMCGHDHAMNVLAPPSLPLAALTCTQHIEFGGVNYFLSGAGGAPMAPPNPAVVSAASKGVKFAANSFGFLAITASERELCVRLVSVDGDMLHNHTFANPRLFVFSGTATTFLLPAIAGTLLGFCCLFICIWKCTSTPAISQPMQDWKERVLEQAWDVSQDSTRGVFEVLSESDDDEDRLVEVVFSDSPL